MAQGPDRRTFLKTSVVAASAAAAGCRPGERAEPSSGTVLPAETLRAVAEVALPSELGPEGRDRVCAEFEAWTAAYDPVAEQVHGYGSQEIRYGPPDPAPGWAAQLRALELEARARHDSTLAALSLERRRRLIADALGADAGDPLPDRPGAVAADHVVLGLLGFFYGSPEATNLCYRRRIDGLSCRPLAASGEVPAPLAASAPDSRAGRPARPADLPSVAARPLRGLEPGS